MPRYAATHSNFDFFRFGSYHYGDTSLSCHWQFCLYADPAALLARARALKTSDLNPSGLVRG